MSKDVTNIAASVRQRLLNLARERNEDFGLVLTKYALERVLFRISASKHRDVFVLKGALLFELWTAQRHRPTRDADFLARGENTPQRFNTIFKGICNEKVTDDGLRLDPGSVTAEQIKEDADHRGVRVNFLGYLENARIPIQIDIGFGDTVTPPAKEAEFPTLLDFPAPTLLTYPRESVVAEKFEAMVKLGIANSRMKDFHDLRVLCREFSFNGPVLSEAVSNTFKRRGTALPSSTTFVTFLAEFYGDEHKKQQWSAFCNKNKLYITEVSLETVCRNIEEFLMPIAHALSRNQALELTWNPTGPWS
ncbi:MAG: nucleotidyl transferase AbiEii/AbiGii toxin family protein [Acidobacteriota bacterium]